MGYRLGVSTIKDVFYGTKLYGYLEREDAEAHEHFKSYQFLKRKGFIDGDEVFSYGFSGDFRMYPSEAREFLKLYAEDMTAYAPSLPEEDKPFDWAKVWPEMEQTLQTAEENHQYILINWG